MRTFLKGNRRKSLDRIRHYLGYAVGEIVLVVIGILIALQINNWNGFRKERNLEKEILVEIKKSLLSDIEYELQPEIDQALQDVRNSNEILFVLDNMKEMPDSISLKFRSFMFSKDLVWGVTANKTLENEGIKVIQNPLLKERIVELYNVKFPSARNAVDNFGNNLIEYFRPMMRDRFVFAYKDLDSVQYYPIDYITLRQDQLFLNTVQTARLNFRNISRTLLNLRQEILDTVEMIDKELEDS
ncbi:DUF6090 family protein [Fulvivirga sedimenti]|uniref:Uncharacterized protein n=1 Tax=Fulvivirga sedimenti TaxID=2879465 RepID=A0A9X1HMX7_9BACT|nr:DUF6090 family protein [Fulvivirga sedimenti]MCA6075103.1 hypothetical protein [Fulvivirga sedimenti]MCA6076280.1 hypothetical protein [Fulvivirga sedimenti]MCA6077408.1 hypothetical protein [Fulvivirga sedimenti]